MFFFHLNSPSPSITSIVALLLESTIVPSVTEVIIVGKLSILRSSSLSLMANSAAHSVLLTLEPLKKVKFVVGAKEIVNPKSAINPIQRNYHIIVTINRDLMVH